MTEVNIFREIEVSAGTTTTKTIYTVRRGQLLRVTRCEVAFPSGVKSQLEVRIQEGTALRYPEQGSYTGDDVKFVSVAKHEFGSLQEVLVWLRNKDLTYPHRCWINISAEYVSLGE